MDEKKIDISELIFQVRARKLQPSQIFSKDELEKDPEFGKIIKSEVDYESWKAEKELKEEQKKIKKEKKLKNENELIPGIEEEKKKKKDQDENELIPDSDNEDSEDNDLIPD